MDWIGKQKDKPFFLYLPFNAQHAPLQAPKKYLDRFPEHQGREAAAVRGHDERDGRRRRGKVLGKVRERQPGGEHAGVLLQRQRRADGSRRRANNGPLRGFKATTLEGGTRVPFCAQWKGTIPAGSHLRQADHPARHPADRAGRGGGKVDPGWKLDGVDLMPYLTGKVKEPPHPVLYWRFGNQWAIRKGDLKLVASNPDGVKTPKLFNLKDDVGEKTDLSEKMPDKVKELQADWDKWSAEQSKPLWVPAKKKDKNEE